MDLRAIAMGLVFAVMWSSAFTSARVIVQYASPLTALSLRFLISGLAGVLIAWALGQSWRLSRAQWRAVILFGICQNGIYLGLNFLAMQWIEASLAAIIASAMPLLVALAGWLVYGQRPRALAMLGLLAGLVGVAIIMGTRLSGGADLVGVAFCVIGVISLTVATLTLRATGSGGNVLMIVGLQMLAGAVLLGLLALAFEEPTLRPSWPFFAAFAYTTIVPGLAATLVWFLLVNRVGAVRAAVFHFLTPFFGVAIAAILLGEGIGLLDGVGVLIVMAGIFAVQISQQRAAA